MANTIATLQALNALQPAARAFSDNGAPPVPPNISNLAGFVPPTPAPPPIMTAPALPPQPPDYPPMAPTPALNQGLVNQFAGPMPAAPVIQEPSTLQRIANGLVGFGAGVQGQGPQYLQMLHEQQMEPIRAYQAQMQAYLQRRMMGLETATKQQQFQQSQQQATANEKAHQDLQVFLQKQGFTHEDTAQEVHNQFQLQLMREQEQMKIDAAQRAQAAAAKKQQEHDARMIMKQAMTEGASGDVAQELGNYFAEKTDTLSPEAQKFESSKGIVAQARAERLARIAAGGKEKDRGMALLENGAIVPISAVDKQLGAVMFGSNLVKVAGYVGGGAQQAPQQTQQPQQGVSGGSSTGLLQRITGGAQPNRAAPTTKAAPTKGKKGDSLGIR